MATRLYLAASMALAWSSLAMVHPGVLIGADQIAFVQEAVTAGQPVATIFFALANTSSTYGDKSYKAKGPPASGTIECGSYSKPNYGCSDEDDDAAAAYTLALLYHLTADFEFANASIAILNAYGHHLKKYTNL
jgi:hypothetical protein